MIILYNNVIYIRSIPKIPGISEILSAIAKVRHIKFNRKIPTIQRIESILRITPFVGYSSAELAEITGATPNTVLEVTKVWKHSTEFHRINVLGCVHVCFSPNSSRPKIESSTQFFSEQQKSRLIDDFKEKQRELLAVSSI